MAGSNAEKLLEAVRRNQICGESPQRAIARAYSLEKAGQRLFWLGLMLAAGVICCCAKVAPSATLPRIQTGRGTS